MVAPLSNRTRSRQSYSTPAETEWKKIDLLGIEVLSSCLGIKVMNYQVVVAHYKFHLWEKMALFLQDLPNDRRLVNGSLMEGQNVAQHSFWASFDVLDSAA